MHLNSLTRFWRERVWGLILAQLSQGVTPQKIALTVALGLSLGIFPILGATTTLCGIVGICLKLNQPIIQMVNWLVYPVQLSLILVFIRIGEWIMRAPHISFSVPELIQKFHESPGRFFQQFGMTGVHGIVAWLIIAPFLTLAAYAGLLLLLKKFMPINASTNPYVK
jgi:uncharacterized protein (DUF2062 family)